MHRGSAWPSSGRRQRPRAWSAPGPARSSRRATSPRPAASLPSANTNSGAAKWMWSVFLHSEWAASVPQPAVARYWAIVVVKLPEFENSATEPCFGELPDDRRRARRRSARDSRKMGNTEASTHRTCRCRRSGRSRGLAMHRDLLGDDHDLLERGIDAGDAVADAGGRQIDHAGVEPRPRVQAFAHRAEDRHLAEQGRAERLAGAAGRGPKTTLPPKRRGSRASPGWNSPPRMLRTQTRSSRVATLASKVGSRAKYLNLSMPCLCIAPRPTGFRVCPGATAISPSRPLFMTAAACRPACGRCSRVPVRPVRIAMAKPLLVLAVRG